MYRLLVALFFRWDVVFVSFDDNVKPLHTPYINYYHLITEVDIASLNNYYYVINTTCDHSQTESWPNLLKGALPQLLFQWDRDRTYSIIMW